MKKIVSLLLTAIMLFCLLPMVMPEDAIAATELVASGGSYYYDGHEHTVAAEVKDGTGYTIQYSYYSVYEKATWTTDVPKLVEPGSLVVYVRAVKGTDILTHDPIRPRAVRSRSLRTVPSLKRRCTKAQTPTVKRSANSLQATTAPW